MRPARLLLGLEAHDAPELVEDRRQRRPLEGGAEQGPRDLPQALVQEALLAATSSDTVRSRIYSGAPRSSWAET